MSWSMPSSSSQQRRDAEDPQSKGLFFACPLSLSALSLLTLKGGESSWLGGCGLACSTSVLVYFHLEKYDIERLPLDPTKHRRGRELLIWSPEPRQACQGHSPFHPHNIRKSCGHLDMATARQAGHGEVCR